MGINFPPIYAYSVDSVDASIQSTISYHIHQLLVDGCSRWTKRSVEVVDSDAREGLNEVEYALSTDDGVQVLEVRLQVDIKEVVRVVRLKNGQAGRISAVDKLGDGPANVRLELEEGTEARVV